MADYKILNLNKYSDKNLFKKGLSLRRKSKSKLIKESFFMLFLGVFIIYLNYLIPNKISIFNNLFNNTNKLFRNISQSIPDVYEIFLAIFVIVSLALAFILILGFFSRILKVARRKTRKIRLK